MEEKLASIQTIRLKANKEAFEELFKTLVRIGDVKAAENFLKDLCSSSEIRDLARRLKCAKLLREGKTYQEIRTLLGMGPLTINKIHFKTRGSTLLPKLLK